jgi:hypothetical protein
MKKLFGPATLLFIGIWLVLLIGGRSRFFQDPGTFWHVATGDRIIAEGFIDTDPFTFTFHGTEWIPYQWLGECVMSVLNRIGGFDMLLLATVTLLAGVYTGIGVRLLRAGFHPSVVAVVLAAGIAASSGHFHVRPLIVTIAGMAILGVYLTDVENGTIPVGRLAWLVPVFWLWANIHGGVMGGLATFALAIGGWVAFRFIKAPSPIVDVRAFVRVFTIWLACVAVCFASPYLHRLPKTWIYIYQMPNLPSIIEEHGPMDVTSWVGIAVLVFGLLYCLLLLSVPVRSFRVVWLLPLVWFALAFLRVRHAPLFAVLALVAVADFFPNTRLAAMLMQKGSDLFSPRLADETLPVRDSLKPFAVPAILVFVVAGLQAAGVSAPVVGRGWAQLDPKIWPVELLPELREHQYDRPQGTRIFCEYHYGGFLIYETPGYRVFVDDRCEVFGDAFLVRYVLTKEMLVTGSFENPGEPFAQWQAEYGSFDLALVATGGGFDKALDRLQPEWEMIRRTETATLYRKAGGPK